jgi:hypothetical protein
MGSVEAERSKGKPGSSPDGMAGALERAVTLATKSCRRTRRGEEWVKDLRFALEPLVRPTISEDVLFMEDVVFTELSSWRWGREAFEDRNERLGDEVREFHLVVRS